YNLPVPVELDTIGISIGVLFLIFISRELFLNVSLLFELIPASTDILLLQVVVVAQLLLLFVVKSLLPISQGDFIIPEFETHDDVLLSLVLLILVVCG
uniref:MgtE domain-containing protein n=1 Tax=Schistosoma curassoni TaxID=6186 RepID=A0A183L5Y6_9TREM